MSDKKYAIHIIEDEADLASILRRKLTTAGYKPSTSLTVADAKIQLTKHAFDCIVLDMHLENEDGEKVINFIRDDSESLNRNTPILVTSAYLDIEVLRRIKSRIESALVKPFDHKTFLLRLAEACQKKQSSGS